MLADHPMGARAIRFVLVLCAGLSLSHWALADSGEWSRFLRRHTDGAGRVIDGAGGGISHSEGQGMGMFLAVHFDDRNTFDRMWQWTRRNLMVRADGLLAWRWTPKEGVTDRNNATDGDMFAAWALLRASTKWKSKEYREDGLALARAVRERLVRQTSRGPVLLPGMNGFEHDGVQTLNLSYWVFPALEDFSRADGAPVWAELIRSGHRLLAQARFGRWGLPPDWLRANERLSLPDNREARFGYDAVRIPLYLLWAGADEEALRAYRSYWSYFGGAVFLPGWSNLRDDSVDSHDALKGMRAIAIATLAYPDLRKAKLPEADEAQPYYSDVLRLLTRAMLWERTKR